MIIETIQLKIIKLTILAVISLFYNPVSESYYCLECEHYLDYEDMLDSGGRCSYCASSRVYEVNERGGLLCLA